MVAAATRALAKVPPEKCSELQGRHTGVQGEKGKMRRLHGNSKAQGRRGVKKFFELKIAEGYRKWGGVGWEMWLLAIHQSKFLLALK